MVQVSGQPHHKMLGAEGSYYTAPSLSTKQLVLQYVFGATYCTKIHRKVL